MDDTSRPVGDFCELMPTGGPAMVSDGAMRRHLVCARVLTDAPLVQAHMQRFRMRHYRW